MGSHLLESFLYNLFLSNQCVFPQLCPNILLKISYTENSYRIATDTQLKEMRFFLFLNFGNLAFQTWPEHDGV